ncbi:uncharacterized protein LOC128550783 [Mercenaria mercenaria]|uniref:uncharacterized protein LOC128550783 n=1 Tax=Mercenaria mercenaria TaxID=6596 RepID=UPI00234EADBF|nr:uncharacterized protein LOC128550783 [Mercenaria mercenaria]
MADSKDVCVTLIVLMCLIPAMAKVIIGAVYMDDCPYENKVPLPRYLIVSGAMSASVLAIFQLKSKCLQVIGIVGVLFSIAWNMCGCVWLYSSYATIMQGFPGTQNCNSTALLSLCPSVSNCSSLQSVAVCPEIESFSPESRLAACKGQDKCCDKTFLKFAFSMSILDWSGLLSFALYVCIKIVRGEPILIDIYNTSSGRSGYTQINGEHTAENN